ncbi:MAG: DUF3492 domain-containing protein [Alphaproteobacteria bacterium]|nr:MAG: DUF3492 domain-containing protein [Alphaproteobacteria bacterium]
MIKHHRPSRTQDVADICFVLEGTYPYVRGGVSSWTHEMIATHSNLTFHLICLLPGTEQPTMKYSLPANVLSITDVFLGDIPSVRSSPSRNIMEILRPAMTRMAHDDAHFEDFFSLVETFATHRKHLDADYLLNSRDAWECLEQMYHEGYDGTSMLDYFWSWRALFGGIFSILLAPLPEAKVYHTLCTGYAGLLAARAKIEKKRPVLVTEHGIYTNERRVEISSADWLGETAVTQLTIDTLHASLRDFWMQTFASASRMCYAACDQIITLYSGNQKAQLLDGAHQDKMSIIPNGVDVARFSTIHPVQHETPTIAMIGRVVPIKDVKNFIMACAAIRDALGDLKVYILGAMDEDIDYVEECKMLVQHLLLEQIVEFTGAVTIDDYLPKIDVVVFTSVSEAQPLVILEAGASGIPIVSTDVGACSEMIHGAIDEQPMIGSGGEIVPLANPTLVAHAVLRLLTDPAYYQSCSDNIRKRVYRYYTKDQQKKAYADLYDHYIQLSERKEVA